MVDLYNAQLILEHQTTVRLRIRRTHSNLTPVWRPAFVDVSVNRLHHSRHTVRNARALSRLTRRHQSLLEVRIRLQMLHRHNHPGRLQDCPRQAQAIQTREARRNN